MSEEVQHKTVLLIDDDQLLLDMYALKFKEAGYTVFAHTNTEEGIAKIEGEDPPDIVLFDMVMPGQNGLEFLQRVRDRVSDRDKKPLLVVLSNQGDEQSIQEAKRLGAAGFILKANTIPSDTVKEVERIIQESHT